MINKLNHIKQPILMEYGEFDAFFKETMKSHIFLLDKILAFIVKRKGKQMRPLFVLLSAAINGNITEKTFRVASLVELLHTATLIHDDIVDDSFKRRNAFTINALWKNKIAVLAGDYLLSRGMLLALKHKDYDMLEICSGAVKLMSEGELLQLQKARTLDIKENVYFDIIRMKTASLFATCCAAGAASAGGSEENTKLMWEFGINCGIAFQIMDDILDFTSHDSGKPAGTDLKEKKLTLPLIYALQNAGNSEKRKIINLIARQTKDNEIFKYIFQFIKNMKGLEYAEEKMTFYKNNAIELLDIYPESKNKTALIELVNYVIERDR